MKNRIPELISRLKEISESSDSGKQLYPHNYMMIPGMIRSLEHIQEQLSMEPPDIEGGAKLARGLGRVITEDGNFSESALGTDLLGIINDLLRSERRVKPSRSG